MQSKIELYNKFVICNQIDSSSQEILKNLYIEKYNLNEFMIDNNMLQKKLKISFSHLKLITNEKLKTDKHYKINLIMNNNRGRPKEVYHYNKIGLIILLDNISIIESEKLKKDINNAEGIILNFIQELIIKYNDLEKENLKLKEDLFNLKNEYIKMKENNNKLDEKNEKLYLKNEKNEIKIDKLEEKIEKLEKKIEEKN